ncbi:DUF2273 domain-containing protein [Glaciibacter flavus]|uniref:DUF2273 domain-containing protein n=1 Tax=Orlajensenia flava TaxID=2565934 RepID=A0A4S4FKD5_9MICO|nr:DUF2273 domain-containing protein [Glaciibacter flavus]THG30348.1 DUF2273 domain-containing protein [Glaciibacter flavus]THG30611.1 DUF2273 domain-containing protein [Glaciibacter flavus]
MTSTVVGILVGAILAVSALVFGFWGFLLVALFMLIGALVGRFAEGRLDIRGVANAFSGKRTS